MKRLLHVSDLHFGRDRPELLPPLIDTINALAPDIVAISGDLTQRARASQFKQARDLIDSLQSPVLVVPGNHDTPLDNLPERIFMPWRRYRKWISTDLEPQVHDPEWSIIGINSVNPLGWQRGWFDAKDIRTVEQGFADTPDTAFRIVVVHHPLEHLPGERKKLMRGADAAISALVRLGTDIVLSGHLHSWRADVFASAPTEPAVLQVHAGTGLSNRLRGQENDFNLLTLDGAMARIDRYVGRDVAYFHKEQSVVFERGETGWRAVEVDTRT